jgi:hypothetical protein
LLDDRLGDAELVDTVAQDRDVLGDSTILNAFLGFRLERRDEPQLAAAARFLQGQVAVGLLDRGACLDALCLVTEPDHDVGTLASDAAVLDLVFPEQRADVGGVTIRGLVESRLHVHLQQKVNPAAEIEAEIHRQRADRSEPLRRRRQQVQGDDIVLAQLGLQHILRFQLRIGIRESDLDAGRIERRAANRNRGGLERVFDGSEQRGVDFRRALRRRDLDRRHFGKQIRQRVEEADRESDADQYIFPERVAVHPFAVRRLRRVGLAICRTGTIRVS